MNSMTGGVETKYSFSTLLELAADNDVEGFKTSTCYPNAIGEIGLWYCRQRSSKKMVIEPRTPLMVAATYGSVDVVKVILSVSDMDVNLSCGVEESTALHCAACSGSANALVVVKLLLQAGADPNAMDVNGHCPFDVIVAHQDHPELKVSLLEILKSDVYINYKQDLQVSSVSLGSNSNSNSSSLASSPDNSSFSSASASGTCKPDNKLDETTDASFVSEKKEYPIDPSLPDIKSSIYATDEFRMFSFKIRPCSRAYSHDWTECPFAHPGENARRRDPRKFHYSCVPCPDFRKGTCKRADLCEYAHGVFECWLHPAQYRTRLCKDGKSCNRRVCFFAHANEELRPLYVSTGSGVPSPRAAAAASASTMDMATILSMMPGSPSAAVQSMSPSPFTPPLSPSANGMSMGWQQQQQQQNIPALHLPGSNLQTSRLRSSFNARDFPFQAERLNMLQDFHTQQQQQKQQQLLDELSYQTQPHFGSGNRSKSLAPSNLDDLFSAEVVVSSPRYSDQLASSVLSPSHKALLFNQLHQKQSMLSPIKTNGMSSPRNVEQQPYLQMPYGMGSPGKMSSPRYVDPISPMNSRLSALSLQDKQQQQQQLHSFSPREFGYNHSHDTGSANNVISPRNPWSKWENSNGKVDWSIQADELGRLRKSCSMGRHEEEPSSSIPNGGVHDNGSNSKLEAESNEQTVLSSWVEQMKIDEIVA